MRKLAPVLLLAVVRHVPWLKKRGWRWFYQTFATFDPGRFSLMNYGYSGDVRMDLTEAEEDERYGFQLYHHVTSAVDLTGCDVLEVACGRGGGAAFIKRHSGAGSVVGVDLSSRAVELCRTRHELPGLTFREGDAEELSLDDASFDAVVNIEAGFCFPSRDRFYAEVYRVLRPGGHFLYADIERSEKVPSLDAGLCDAGFEILRRDVINDGVIRACDLDCERRRAFVDDLYRLKVLRKAFYGFAAVPGFFVYGKLREGELTYLCWTGRKPA